MFIAGISQEKKSIFTVKAGSNPVPSTEWVSNTPAVETTGAGRSVDIRYEEEELMES